MASWMVHLRVADQIMKQIEQQTVLCEKIADQTMVSLDEDAFVMGNIAPDSGVPTEDGSAYVPDKKTSHFKSMRGAKVMAEMMGRQDGKPQIDIESFVEKYFTKEQRKSYDQRQYSFYLGYLVHLLTDLLWVRDIYWPAVQAESEAYAADFMGTVRKWKRDWYDLDFLYLQEHPDFKAFATYEAAVDFHNDLMDEFSADAFENRRRYITWFYHQKRDDLDRHYPYLNKEQMNRFVRVAVKEIVQYVVDNVV